MFSAPEQINAGIAATEATDVFMLAATIATWFGQHPFGAIIPAHIKSILGGKSQLEMVPAPVRTLLVRALVTDSKACGSMRELANDLRALAR